MTRFAILPFALLVSACNNTPPASKPVAEAQPKSKIDQFYSPTPRVAKGDKGELCYGVSFTKELTLTPPVAEVWPAVSRCVEVSPAKTTAYTLRAKGADGTAAEQTVEIKVGPPHARIFDIWASSIDQQAGQPLRICFKTEDAIRVTVSAGKFDSAKNCIDDNPMKNTSYRIAVFGAEGEPALGQVDVKVHP